MSIRCFYYSYNFDNLETSFEKSLIANASDHVIEAGEYVIVCANQNPGQQLYGFLAVSEGVIPNVTAKKYWPDFHRPHSRVTRVKVISRLVKIPLHIAGGMTRAGIRKCHRDEVSMFLRSKPVEIRQEVRPIVINEKPKLKPQIGFVYILQIPHGYKIGITTNLDARMKQLEVPEKASIIGHWQSKDYTVLERLLHSMYKEKRVPQSEWFLINEQELQPALHLLNTTAKCLIDNSKPIELKPYSTNIPTDATVEKELNEIAAKANRKLFGALSALGIVLLIAGLVSACSTTTTTEVEPRTLPVYCIRDVVFLDNDPQGQLLLDMPGYPYGQTDKYQQIDKQTYNELDVPVCKSDDPRMALEASGIAWADGRDTSLDELPESVE